MKLRAVSGESKWRWEHKKKNLGALLLSQFDLLAALNFQLFGMATAYKMSDGTKVKPVIGCIYLSATCSYRKTYLQAYLNSLTSYCLTLQVCIEDNVLIQAVWALKSARQRIRFSILSTLFNWNFFSFIAAAILFLAKQNNCACPSWLFSPHWNSVSITQDFFIFSGWIVPRAESLSM